MTCSVPDCKNILRLMLPNASITFHRFPKGERFSVFKNIINRPDLQWGPKKYICSAHFEKTDFIEKSGRRFLRDTAIPTLKLRNTSTPATLEIERKPSSTSSEDELRPSKKIKTQLNEPVAHASSSSSTATVTSPERKMLPQNSEEQLPHASTDVAEKQREILRGVSSQIVTSSGSTSSTTKRKRVSLVHSLHNYSGSPGKENRKKVQAKKKVKKYSVAFYRARKQVTQLQKQVTCLQQVADELKGKKMLSENGFDSIQRIVDDVPKELLARYLKNVERGSTSREEYPPHLRRFAMTLQFFSCRAYEYVRDTFKLCLPHQDTLRKWFSAVECEPGFSQISLDLLKSMSNDRNENIICSLSFDEMAIKKKIEFDGKRTWGYVDFGITMDDDDLNPASEALVFMVVCHTERWKLPLGYFFIKSLTGPDKANIVKEALIRLNDAKVDVTSVTCDGPAAHFAMFSELGCNWNDVNNMKSFFLHPSTGVKIYAIIDVCHLLKLVRNNFAHLGVIIDDNDQKIEWKYIEKLHTLQEQEGLRCGNKLKSAHINWEAQKMKVSLAAQTLSKSVADSMEFLRSDLKDEDFENSEATIRFINIVNNLFDILNSKNAFSKGFKSPLRIGNTSIWHDFLVDTQKYLLSLKDFSGNLLWQTKKKTPFLGFAITIQSVLGIYEDYVVTQRLKYFLTYKISQDHLEMFFCSIRSRNGWNNNPTCLQFSHSYRKLLLNADVPGQGGNCKVLDTTKILDISSNIARKQLLVHPDVISFNRKFNFDLQLEFDHDYDVLAVQLHLDTYIENVVTYISGYVVRMTQRTIKCVECLNFLPLNKNISLVDYQLLDRKNRGGLIVPSRGVKEICLFAEKYFRKLMMINNNKVPNEKNMIETLIFSIYTNFQRQFIQNIDKYFPVCSSALPLEDHRIGLIKCLIANYVKIRVYNLCKTISENIQGPQIRKQFSKLILFKHQ